MVLRSFDSTGEASVQLEENYASTTRDAVVTRWLYMGESESDTVLRNLGLNSEKMDFLVTKSKKRTAVPQSGSAVKERRQLLGRSCFWTERWCGPSGKSTWGSPRQGGSSPPAHYNMSPKHTHTRAPTHTFKIRMIFIFLKGPYDLKRIFELGCSEAQLDRHLYPCPFMGGSILFLS